MTNCDFKKHILSFFYEKEEAICAQQMTSCNNTAQSSQGNTTQRAPDGFAHHMLAYFASDEKSDGASDVQSLCGIASNISDFQPYRRSISHPAS
ncbi:MAG: hypothetical protein ACI4XB_07965 [Ruminococcus sp.]